MRAQWCDHEVPEDKWLEGQYLETFSTLREKVICAFKIIFKYLKAGRINLQGIKDTILSIHLSITDNYFTEK